MANPIALLEMGCLVAPRNLMHHCGAVEHPLV